MTDRSAQIDHFLQVNDLAHVARTNLAGDASNRRYFRLTHSDGPPLVLMDAPPSKGEDICPFVRIAKYLKDIGLSAPNIVAQDDANGFLILEDLGDDLFARLVDSHPEMEVELYTSATDLLVDLHRHRPPADLAAYDASNAAELAALSIDWYAFGVSETKDDQSRDQLAAEMARLIKAHAPQCDVLVQRDFHSENLLWLANRTSHRRVGLLDFQDALAGHRSYDLVSLLQDARRDVSPEIEIQMVDHYIASTGQNADQFKKAYAVWGAQRNLRILGVFARLCMRDGKPGYIPYIPRVWNLLRRDLVHPGLDHLNRLVSDALPEPSLGSLSTLEAKCARTP